eukprot:3140181-Lingulodinium_polyedra.AAC.1
MGGSGGSTDAARQLLNTCVPTFRCIACLQYCQSFVLLPRKAPCPALVARVCLQLSWRARCGQFQGPPPGDVGVLWPSVVGKPSGCNA